MSPKQEPSYRGYAVVILRTMCSKLYTQSLFAGLTLISLVRQSITRKLLQRFGNFGRDISLIGQVLVNASDLPDARSRRGVNGGEELRARPVNPFGGGRPWLRRTRALCKFNCGKSRF